ncbi:MAG: family transcriptional regulator, cyclic receptor protein [Chthoniobacter sp.]|jgi:CRP-like cAMP-binding protein|nr:family transcriptional regulator, cyclic receptor protein [Chthoniobacter sp.]
MSTELRPKIRAMSLFAEFTDDELEGLLDLVDTITVPPDTCIVKQDERGDCMYVLTDGSAKVSHNRDGKKFELAVLEPGDFFGEIALVDEGPRSADVEALTPCSLMKIEHAALRAVAGVYPSAAFKLLIAVGRVMVARMRRGNKKYIDSLLAAAVGKD